MASIVSKLARSAVASRASLAAVSPCLPRRLHLIGRHMCSSVTHEGKGHEIWIGGPIPEEAEEEAEEEAQRALTVTSETLKSDEALRAMYEYWCRYHGVSRDRAEMDRRLKIFKRSAKFVHKTNNSGVSYKLGLNQYSDLTAAEIARTRG